MKMKRNTRAECAAPKEAKTVIKILEDEYLMKKQQRDDLVKQRKVPVGN